MSYTNQVREILAALLDVPVELITAKSTMDDVEQWDSLAQMNLVIALEEEFDVVIPDDDVGTLMSVPLIVALLDELLR